MENVYSYTRDKLDLILSRIRVPTSRKNLIRILPSSKIRNCPDETNIFFPYFSELFLKADPTKKHGSVSTTLVTTYVDPLPTGYYFQGLPVYPGAQQPSIYYLPGLTQQN